jgi:alkylhydroperoxidase family enzyme
MVEGPANSVDGDKLSGMPVDGATGTQRKPYSKLLYASLEGPSRWLDHQLLSQERTMAHPTHYTSQVAIPLPSDEAVRQIIGASYDPEKTLNVIKMFAGTEDMFEAIIGLVKAVFQAQGIDPKTREMIILRAAAVLNSPCEWQANVLMGKNTGLSAEEIDATATDGPVAGINPEYVLVCKATDELSISGTLRDETLSELLDRYGETISRKIVLLIAWFNLLSLFLNGCRVPLETTDKIGATTSPLSRIRL